MARRNGGSKKGRNGNKKHGRNRKSPAMIRYNAEGRCEKNKARKAKRAR